MAKKPTLLVLAAGMGSRYGSLKQMDGVGPNSEAIIDYSIYDAIRAGFGRVVFVIRRSFAEQFKELFSAHRFGGRVEVDYVFQELDALPVCFALPIGRAKPWGTNHAIMMGAQVIDGAFAVINADDFYGKESYQVVAEHLRTVQGGANNYCMAGYKLSNTLSEYGAVSRGVCTVDGDDYLLSVVERSSIERIDGEIRYRIDGDEFSLDGEELVSMNMFGFTPDYFLHSERRFKEFLRDNIANPTAEFYIPTMVNELVQSRTSRLKILRTDATWFGVTYKQDRPMVVERIKQMIDKGEYPHSLWG